MKKGSEHRGDFRYQVDHYRYIFFIRNIGSLIDRNIRRDLLEVIPHPARHIEVNIRYIYKNISRRLKG